MNKKKKFLGVVLAFSILVGCVPIIACAETGTKYGDYLYYTINGDKTAVTITDCSVFATEIEIPAEINGLPVTSIGKKAFLYCPHLTSITIPNSVTSIGNFAFSECTGLTSIIIGNSVKSIGEYAFSDCNSLTSIIIPDSVTNIDSSAFFNTEYYKDSTNWENGVLYIGNHLIKADSDTISSDYTIKDGTKTIACGAFEGCDGLESVIIGDSVTSIGQNAFSWNESLKSVTIGDSVTSIGEEAFRQCTGLTSITIGDSVTSVGQNAFYSTAYYDDRNNWENGVLYIGKYLIAANVSGDYSIKDGTKTIVYGSFSGCSSLTSITIPDSVISIDDYTFSGCKSLKEVYFKGTETQWQAIDIGYSNDELKNATIHYNSAGDGSATPTPKPTATPTLTPIPIVPTITAEITRNTSAETDDKYAFDIAPTAETIPENCFVYAAVYDENGVLLRIDSVPLETDGTTTVTVDKSDKATTAKVFVWAKTMQAIVETPQEFDLKAGK